MAYHCHYYVVDSIPTFCTQYFFSNQFLLEMVNSIQSSITIGLTFNINKSKDTHRYPSVCDSKKYSKLNINNVHVRIKKKV